MATNKVVLVTDSEDTFCKHCGKPQRMFWFDSDKKNGQSETFCRDMHISCYEAVYNKKFKTLQELNEDRKSS